MIPKNKLDPVALKLMTFYPQANRPPDSIAGGNNFRANSTTGLTHDFYSAKIDHNLGSKDRLTGRYMYNRDNSSRKSVFPDPAADQNNFPDPHHQFIYSSWTRTLTPSTLNAFHFNHSTRLYHI